MISDKFKIITFPKVSDERGQLSWIEGNDKIPFEIRRVFYITGVPEFTIRGNHAHKSAHQFIIPIKGSVEISLDDGNEKTCFMLHSNSCGIHVFPMVWCILRNFSTEVCLVLVSEHYDKNEYIRDYKLFLEEIKK